MNIKNLLRSALLLAIAIIFQIVGKNVPAISQAFVGPAVNAVLIITAYTCGTVWGITVGALTPLLAWLTAQLPSPMGPFIPFIMMGNCIFVTSFGLLKNKGALGKTLGIVIGAILKYLFLFLSASKLVSVFKLGIPEKIAEKLIIMMGLPQLATALVGGFAALALIEILRKRKVID